MSHDMNAGSPTTLHSPTAPETSGIATRDAPATRVHETSARETGLREIAHAIKDERTVWAPPQSPLSIAYPARLLQDLRWKSHRRDMRGILYGVQKGNRIELAAARPRARWQSVGIFVVRVRGEVFLTEGDLDFLDASGQPMALVLAGSRGGFFVWEPAKRNQGGSHLEIGRCIQSIKSYQEFSLEEEAPLREPRRIAEIVRGRLFAVIP